MSLAALGAVVVIIAVISMVATSLRRRGYQVGGWTLVRCSAGHLFYTLFVPGVSLKAVRLGTRRFQRCPVGRHWSLVALAREADYSEAQLAEARRHRDRPVP
jgi:hypothetical protein